MSEGNTLLADKPPVYLEGVCGNCLGSGFVHVVKDGVLGVAFRYEGEDSFGNQKKRPLKCDHDFKHTY